MSKSDLVGRRDALTLIGLSGLGLGGVGLAGCAGVPGNDEPGSSTPSARRTSPDPSTTTTSTTASPTKSATSSPTGPAAAEPDFQLPAAKRGLVPVLTRVPTKQPVVFLSIDDGVTKRAEALAALQHYGYPVTMFLTKNTIQNDPEYFRGFQALGNRIQNHTVSHDTTMWAKPFAYQYAEIKVMQDYAQEAFGRAPTLFRPPGGRYSKATRRAAGQAGLKAIIDWEALVSGGQMQYQVGAKLRPGDIVLMHFRPEFEADLKAFHQARLEAGLKVQRLDDFLGV